MDQQHFLASEYAPARPEDAAFHIIPAPLERSVSYGGGAAQGPAALLDALVIGVTRAMGPEGVDALKALHRWKKTYFPDR